MWAPSLYILVLSFLGVLGNENAAVKNVDRIASREDFAEILHNLVVSKDAKIAPPCTTQILQYVKSLKKMELWALQMLDAKTKIPPSGILRGNIMDFGDFDECLKIETNFPAQNSISGKYCLGSVPLFVPTDNNSATRNWSERLLLDVENPQLQQQLIPILLATCLPDACSAADIQEIYVKIGLPVQFRDNMCQTKSSQPELTNGDIATISFLSVILWIMLVSTVYDCVLFYIKKESHHPFLIAFSVLSNGKKLLATSKAANQISCLHGIRVISMMWVILAHRFGVTGLFPKRNLLDVIKWAGNEANMYVMGATVSVDTFFLLGGLVIAYGFMGAMSKGLKFNVALYYVHRYLRLTPILAVLILIYVTVFKHLGSGPLWPLLITNQAKSCQDYWWSSLLYVQNYVNPNHMCVGQTWYLSVDTQLFLLSPIILVPLKKWPKIGLSITGVLTLATIATSFLVAWFYNLYGLILANTNQESYMQHYYMATHTRAGPWLIGILLGYYVYEIKQKHKRIVINNSTAAALWAISLTIRCACVFAGHNTLTEAYDRVGNAFYVALLRHGWAIGVGLVIILCVIGHGGPVNWFLSLPAFQVISKFNYSMYLFHGAIQMLISGQIRTSLVFSSLETLYAFWGDFAFTLAVSVLFTLAFESPIIVLEKIVFAKPTEKVAVPAQSEENERWKKIELP